MAAMWLFFLRTFIWWKFKSQNTYSAVIVLALLKSLNLLIKSYNFCLWNWYLALSTAKTCSSLAILCIKNDCLELSESRLRSCLLGEGRGSGSYSSMLWLCSRPVHYVISLRVISLGIVIISDSLSSSPAVCDNHGSSYRSFCGNNFQLDCSSHQPILDSLYRVTESGHVPELYKQGWVLFGQFSRFFARLKCQPIEGFILFWTCPVVIGGQFNALLWYDISGSFMLFIIFLGVLVI